MADWIDRRHTGNIDRIVLSRKRCGIVCRAIRFTLSWWPCFIRGRSAVIGAALAVGGCRCYRVVGRADCVEDEDIKMPPSDSVRGSAAVVWLPLIGLVYRSLADGLKLL